MCGIAGLVAGRDDVVDAATVHTMCQTIIHRGPDDEGLYVKGPVGLGMRRLSIIDLGGGHQPIHNEDRSVWVVFNGEIYNFPELRSELKKRGHQFYTHSDTEVIVHLYEDLGADFVRKLRGMFAIALYDERQRNLLLVRDRLGKKPLYYALDRGRLLFGSEIKAILSVAPHLTDISPEALLQYFHFGYIADPNSAFEQIHKLPPGYLLNYASGAVQIEQYWDLPAYGVRDPGSEEACLEELEHRLAEAVRIRLISDVPLGALLSGGVDSSVVVALMARASTKPVKTFSIGFSKEDFNEAKYARAVAERFSTQHHEFMVDPQVNVALEKLTPMMEEPFGDSSIVPTYYVSQIARREVTVALSGDGGDELFAGYDRYIVHLARQKYERVPGWIGEFFRRSIFPQIRSKARGRRLVYNILLSGCDRYLDSMAYLPARDRERGLFSTEFLEWADGRDPRASYRNFFDHAPAPDRLGHLLYLDTKTYLTADVLTKVDRMSMANSLEVRCPILDHTFVEWVTGLTSDCKLRLGTRKYALRKLAKRLGVPNVDRPKQGFAMPLIHWWRGESKDMLAILSEPRTLQRGYFNAKAVRELIGEHMSGRRDRAYELWLLLMFELWHRNFLEAREWGKGSPWSEHRVCVV